MTREEAQALSAEENLAEQVRVAALINTDLVRFGHSDPRDGERLAELVLARVEMARRL